MGIEEKITDIDIKGIEQQIGSYIKKTKIKSYISFGLMTLGFLPAIIVNDLIDLKYGTPEGHYIYSKGNLYGFITLAVTYAMLFWAGLHNRFKVEDIKKTYNKIIIQIQSGYHEEKALNQLRQLFSKVKK